MLSRNRIFAITVFAFVFLAMSIAAYLFFHQPDTPHHSLLLYTNYQSPETITNWIVDTDTGEKREVGKGLATGGWSPSGKYLDFHTLSPSPIEIWVSGSTGGNIRQVFDGRDYPDLKITGYDWLTDELILVNVVSKAENSGFLYSLNVDTLSFNRLSKGNFLRISPRGRFWIQWVGQDELADLSGKIIPIAAYLSDYYFSPTEDSIVYSCEGKYKFSSLCLASVNTSGIANNHKIAEDVLLNVSGEMWWSQDGKYVGFLYSPDESEIKFRAIDVTNGAIVYNWTFPTKTTRNFWSPRGDKIIDFDGLLLDLKTGQVSDFFAKINESVPSYVVDWRIIESP